MLPNRLFLTGVPGSRWSGIHQTLSEIPGVNRSDEVESRTYSHHGFSGHKGVYFGSGMEYFPALDREYIDSAWSSSEGMKIVKSHEWALVLDDIVEKFPDDWIMLIYRPTDASLSWWLQAGGFSISYPNYDYYVNEEIMRKEIDRQNTHMLDFACRKNLSWSYLTGSWIKNNFGVFVDVKTHPDILVTLYRR